MNCVSRGPNGNLTDGARRFWGCQRRAGQHLRRDQGVSEVTRAVLRELITPDDADFRGDKLDHYYEPGEGVIRVRPPLRGTGVSGRE